MQCDFLGLYCGAHWAGGRSGSMRMAGVGSCRWAWFLLRQLPKWLWWGRMHGLSCCLTQPRPGMGPPCPPVCQQVGPAGRCRQAQALAGSRPPALALACVGALVQVGGGAPCGAVALLQGALQAGGHAQRVAPADNEEREGCLPLVRRGGLAASQPHWWQASSAPASCAGGAWPRKRPRGFRGLSPQQRQPCTPPFCPQARQGCLHRASARPDHTV